MCEREREREREKEELLRSILEKENSYNSVQKRSSSRSKGAFTRKKKKKKEKEIIIIHSAASVVSSGRRIVVSVCVVCVYVSNVLYMCLKKLCECCL